MLLKQQIKVEVLPQVESEVDTLGIRKQFDKQKKLFVADPNHPSLDFKSLKGKVKGVYSFRINKKYRARLIKSDKSSYQIFQAGDFH